MPDFGTANVNVSLGAAQWVPILVAAIRSLVRPVALFLIIGGFVGFLANGDLEAAKLTAAFGGPVMGWWFAERQRNGGSQ